MLKFSQYSILNIVNILSIFYQYVFNAQYPQYFLNMFSILNFLNNYSILNTDFFNIELFQYRVILSIEYRIHHWTSIPSPLYRSNSKGAVCREGTERSCP